jgi:hypothetical protein
MSIKLKQDQPAQYTAKPSPRCSIGGTVAQILCDVRPLLLLTAASYVTQLITSSLWGTHAPVLTNWHEPSDLMDTVQPNRQNGVDRIEKIQIGKRMASTRYR